MLLASSAFARSSRLLKQEGHGGCVRDAGPESGFWKDVSGIVVSSDSVGKPVSKNRMETRSCWTSGNVYILFICDLDELNLKPNPVTAEETNKLWEWDTYRAFRIHR